MNILITGICGFIGFNLAQYLQCSGHNVKGIDNLTSSYSHPIQEARRQNLKDLGVEVLFQDLRNVDFELTRKSLGYNGNLDVLIHLAAWPGVLRSVSEPEKYFDNNVDAFMDVLKSVKILSPKTFLYASSSSVYGDLARDVACQETDKLPEALNFYALTKQMNEQIANQYHFPNTQICGLRFFTVFGPWGRPDMAYWKFADAILNRRIIELRGENGGFRDFTSVNDLVRVIENLCTSNKNLPPILNMAKGESRPTLELITNLEKHLGIAAKIDIVARSDSEASSTLSDPTLLNSTLGEFLWTDFETATQGFANWFKGQK
jgi:UDP-glucuronate 4-epimerase